MDNAKSDGPTSSVRPSEARIHHAVKTLRRALKKARTFEQRKLARKGDKKGLEALTALDLSRLSIHHVNKKLRIQSDHPSSNIIARLFNTKPIKEAMPIVNEILTKSAGIRAPVSQTTEPADASKRRPDGLHFKTGSSDLDLFSHSQKPISRARKADKSSFTSPGLEGEDPAQPTSQPPRKFTNSTFIPSLSYPQRSSGSGSVIDLDEVPRTKRKGQRARRKDWERKYGSNARHLQNNNHTDPKRFKYDTNLHAKHQNKLKKSTTARDTFPQMRQVVPKPVKAEDGPLHPSWEAAKLAKDRTQSSFQGKKVVFD